MSEHLIVVAMLLGAIEGLTEFLPISSSGHLIIAGHLLGFTGENAAIFNVVIQLGAMLAVVGVLRRKLLRLIPCSWETIGNIMRYPSRRLTALHLLLGVLPVALMGVTLYQPIKRHLFTPHTLLYGLLAGSLLLLFAEGLKGKTSGDQKGDEKSDNGKIMQQLDAITHWQALAVGCFQCLALWPGFSRAGATIAGGMLVGISRATATEFSFMLALPTMLGASGVVLCKSWHLLSLQNIPLLTAGFTTAFLVSTVTVRYCLALIKWLSLIPFALYRLLLTIGVYWLFY